MTSSIVAQKQTKESTREVFVFPCSFAQRRLWFLHQLEPATPVYNIVAPMQVSGPLDITALNQSLNEVVHRHESLRTTFSSVQGEPMQIVACSQTMELEFSDLSPLRAEERATQSNQIITEKSQQPFDLEKGPLLRVVLLKEGQQDHVLLLVMHHIISDGWSMSVLMYEVSVLYDCFHRGASSSLQELPLQYADFSEWQRKRLSGDVLAKQLEYWKQQLEGMPPALELPADWPRNTNQEKRGAHLGVSIPAELADQLQHLARSRNATPYMVLLAGLQALLSRYSGQEDISVGSPTAGRSRPQTENLIGFFVSTLVMRTRLSGAPSFLELLDRVKQVSLTAYAHQDVPFEKLVEVLAPARDLGRTPLFQVMFVLQNTPQAQLRLGSCTLSLLEVHTTITKFDLTLSLEESGKTISGDLDYRADLWETSTASRFLRHYQALLASAITDPNRPVAILPLLDDHERAQLLVEWNGKEQAGFPKKCAHEFFEDYAARMPSSIAVADEAEELTYAELNQRANRLAGFLRSLGVAPEVSVGIFIEPSVAMMVGILGILKAGGGYVPLDPVFPEDRINYILSDSRVSVLLTHSELSSRITAPGIKVVCLDTIQDALAGYDCNNLTSLATSKNRIYTIYTSGSTGRPKGVVLEHRQLVNYLHAILRRFELGPGAQYAMLQPLAVDACNTVLFPAMCGGGTLHTLPRSKAADPYAVQSYFQRHRIDVLKIAPSHLAALLDACPSSELLPHGILALGGEGSNWDWIRTKVQPHAPDGSRTFIHYGPTETTVGVLTNPVRPDAPCRGALVPLGTPLDNVKAYVLDPAMQPCPVSVPGEIYIGGDCVARGYLNRPGLTAEKFIADPFSSHPGTRLYRTGDMGRWLPEGEIEFLGRTDYQVKIRGFRIELGEVESTLRQHSDVNRAVAIAREDPVSGKQLVAYVTLKHAETESGRRDGDSHPPANFPAHLRDFMRERLPDYMVPAATVVLETMPLSPQGKVEFKALPDPSFEKSTGKTATVKPRTLLEAQLVEVWEEVLQTKPIGITDDFFQLGGHSLLAVRMIALMRNRFQRSIALQSLFRNPTIAHLARVQDVPDRSSSGTLVELEARGSATPFFCVHPIGGNVLCYAELARAMGRQRRFFGVQSPPAGHPEGMETVEEMASVYVREIQRVQAHGPYLLGGWSMGGLIAFETAKQLRNAGERIGLLALFDTYPPPQNREDMDATRSLDILTRFAADLGSLMNIDVSASRERFLELDDAGKKQLLFEILKREGVLANESSYDELQTMYEVFERNALALNRYFLQPTLDRVVLFYATETEQPDYLSRKWAGWTGPAFSCHPISTGHYGIMRGPQAVEAAKLLQTYFDQIESQNTTLELKAET